MSCWCGSKVTLHGVRWIRSQIARVCSSITGFGLQSTQSLWVGLKVRKSLPMPRATTTSPPVSNFTTAVSIARPSSGSDATAKRAPMSIIRSAGWASCFFDISIAVGTAVA